MPVNGLFHVCGCNDVMGRVASGVRSWSRVAGVTEDQQESEENQTDGIPGEPMIPIG